MNNEKVKFLLNWNHFTDHLSSCMTKLMTDISYSDIIIATSDKHMIYSHRFVLANSSKYFQRLLRNINRQREIQLVVALPEIKYEIFKILMNYMYKGETQVPHELLPSVIKAGQFLEINGLVNLSENESGGNNANISKCNSSTAEQQSRCSIIHSSSSGSSGGGSGSHKMEMKKTAGTSSTLRDQTHSRENAGVGSKNVFRNDKRNRNQSSVDALASDISKSEETGKENRSKLGKVSANKGLHSEKKDLIQLPLKRKSVMRDQYKKGSPTPVSSSSISNESLPPKKSSKRVSSPQEIFPVNIKDEKEIEDNLLPENQETEEFSEKITIKKEEPDEIEEVVYNELQCEFCHEVYTDPSDWVRHMTEQHEDRGYQSFKDLDKSVGGSAVISCVVCSCVCFSAAEWANHLRLWHTDGELAVANMTAPKKSNNKVRKKSGLHKKE